MTAVDGTWEEFGAEVEHAADATVIRVRGEVDMHTAPKLWRSAEAVLEPGARVVVDVHEVVFMDSQGVKVLARAAEEVGAGGEVTVRGARPPLRRVFEITGLDRMVALTDE